MFRNLFLKNKTNSYTFLLLENWHHTEFTLILITNLNFISEIPLFHVMNACITFGNTFALDEPVPGISIIEEDQVGDDQQKRLSCVVDDVCFEIPEDYSVYGIGGGRTGGGGGRANGNSGGVRRTQFSMDEEDELLQYAIQQSLLDVGSEGDQVNTIIYFGGNRIR